MEFMNIMLFTVLSPGGFLKKTRLYSLVQKYGTYTKIRETRKLESIRE
jgi:hypothetical protein